MQSDTIWSVEKRTVFCRFSGPINWDAFDTTLEAVCATLDEQSQPIQLVLDMRDVESFDMDAIHHLRRTAQVAAQPCIAHIAVVIRGAYLLTMFNVFLRLYTPIAHKFRLVSSPDEAFDPQVGVA
ncbi:MAG: hypothetical protein HC828_12515 [Blastochloris sp.]|nr:hypothetical protein [Blastochloris sp.]